MVGDHEGHKDRDQIMIQLVKDGSMRHMYILYMVYTFCVFITNNSRFTINRLSVCQF